MTDPWKITQATGAVAVLVLLLGTALVSAEPSAKKIQPIVRDPASLREPEPPVARIELNTSLGTTVFHGFALASGIQFGYAVSPERPLYVGPEIAFSLFSPGSILGVLGAVWYELRLPPGSSVSIALGLAGGAGFSAQLSALPTTSSVIFAETSLIEDLNDLVSLREQIRPGLIGPDFALQITLALSFHFY